MLFTVRLGQNILGGATGNATIGAVLNDDVVWINDVACRFSRRRGLKPLSCQFDQNEKRGAFRREKHRQAAICVSITNPALALDPSNGFQVRVVTMPLRWYKAMGRRSSGKDCRQTGPQRDREKILFLLGSPRSRVTLRKRVRSRSL